MQNAENKDIIDAGVLAARVSQVEGLLRLLGKGSTHGAEKGVERRIATVWGRRRLNQQEAQLD